MEQSLLQFQHRLLLLYIAFSLHMWVCMFKLVDSQISGCPNSFDSVISCSKWQMKFQCACAGAGGLSFLQFCNLNSFRVKFILGFSIFIGLSVPQYFNEYTAINGFGPVHTSGRWVWIKPFQPLYLSCPWFNLFIKPCQYWFLLTESSYSSLLQFNDMVNVPFSSEPFVAGCVAFFLDNTLHKRDGQVRKDRGRHWWDKFWSFKGDTRSEEFYSLPFNLNKYFPSVWFNR